MDDTAGDASTPEVTEVVPGEYEVRTGQHTVRVVVPAGVGVPGVPDDELAGTLVALLAERGGQVPPVIDVSAILREDPELLESIADRQDPDT
jgi:hypothetical protein